MSSKKQSSEFSQTDLDIFVSILKGESFKKTGENYNISSDEVKNTVRRLYIHAYKRGYITTGKHTYDIDINEIMIELRKDPDYYISAVTDMIEGKEPAVEVSISKSKLPKVISRHELLWLTDDLPYEDSNNEDMIAARKVLGGWKEERVKEIALLIPGFFMNQDDWNEDPLCADPDSIDQLMHWLGSLEFMFCDISDPLSDPVFDDFNINIIELTSILILMELFDENPFAATKGAMILAELNEEARENRLLHITTTFQYMQHQGLGNEKQRESKRQSDKGKKRKGFKGKVRRAVESICQEIGSTLYDQFIGAILSDDYDKEGDPIDTETVIDLYHALTDPINIHKFDLDDTRLHFEYRNGEKDDRDIDTIKNILTKIKLD